MNGNETAIVEFNWIRQRLMALRDDIQDVGHSPVPGNPQRVTHCENALAHCKCLIVQMETFVRIAGGVPEETPERVAGAMDVNAPGKALMDIGRRLRGLNPDMEMEMRALVESHPGHREAMVTYNETFHSFNGAINELEEAVSVDLSPRRQHRRNRRGGSRGTANRPGPTAAEMHQ